MKNRLDQILVQRGLASTRSQAENYIKLGYVRVDGRPATKAGLEVSSSSDIKLLLKEQYVSRAALKLASVADKLQLDFKDKVVLDVGSSTGGFTDFALKHGAKKVIAVDVGSKQLHPSLRSNKKIELHEKTDIRDVRLEISELRRKTQNSTRQSPIVNLPSLPDIVLADLSFISLRLVLPHLAKISGPNTQIVVLLKPQFEAQKQQINRGIVKNDRLRRQILKDFEIWVKNLFIILNKADSSIAGTHGNQERFYLLKRAKH